MGKRAPGSIGCVTHGRRPHRLSGGKKLGRAWPLGFEGNAPTVRALRAAVGGACPHVGDGSEVLRQRLTCRGQQRVMNGLPHQCLFTQSARRGVAAIPPKAMRTEVMVSFSIATQGARRR